MSETSVRASRSDEVPFLDIVDPEFDFSAPEVFEAQASSWFAKTPVGLLVLGYAEVRDLLRDQRLDHNGERFLEMSGVVRGPIYDWFVPMIVNRDGDDHRRLRGLVGKAFTPRMIDNLRPFIRTTARQLTEHLAMRETCEFVEDFGDRLPLAVLCKLLGVPTEDCDTFSTWTTDLGLVFSLTHDGDLVARVEAAVVALSGYVESLLDNKRVSPRDDLISTMAAVQRSDGNVSTEELCNLIVTLVLAAHDSTRDQFGNAMIAFSEHPEQWRLLRHHPKMAARCVEELARWCPSVPVLFRFANQDFDYKGLRITKDTYLMMCAAAAQRDPHVFRDGSRFDIAAVREAPPLQFGAGPHHCLGAALARAELGEALPVLTSRLGPPVVAGSIAWRPPIGFHGPATLPLRFDAP